MAELDRIIVDGTTHSIGGSSQKEILIKEFSGDSYSKYGDTFIHTIDGALFNACFTYAARAFSVDVKANKLYVLAYLFTSSTAKRATAFEKNRFDTSVTGAVELNNDGTLGNVVTDFNPEFQTWYFLPTNVNSQIWDTETYDQYNNRVYSQFPKEISGTTYYWTGVAFVPNRDFHGVIAVNGTGGLIMDDNYCLLFEVNDETWNPYVDGGMEKGYELEKLSEVSQEEREEIAQIAIQSYAEKYNWLYGKKWAACGDSLTQYSGGGGHTDNSADTGFITQIMRVTGIEGKNLGTAAKRWSSSTDGTFEAGSAVERVNTIVNGTEDYDIITFAYGTNTDTDGEGTADDEPAYDGTMCAAIKWCIEQLVAWKPTISIGIILPPKRADMGSSGNIAMKSRGDLIRSVAVQYGVPCCDMWSESGINLMHYTNPDTGNEKYYYLSDTLHLSDNGKIMYAKLLKSFLEDIAPIY